MKWGSLHSNDIHRDEAVFETNPVFYAALEVDFYMMSCVAITGIPTLCIQFVNNIYSESCCDLNVTGMIYLATRVIRVMCWIYVYVYDDDDDMCVCVCVCVGMDKSTDCGNTDYQSIKYSLVLLLLLMLFQNGSVSY